MAPFGSSVRKVMSSSRIRSESLGFMRREKRISKFQDTAELSDLPIRQHSQVGFAFSPAGRHMRDCGDYSPQTPICDDWQQAAPLKFCTNTKAVSLDLCEHLCGPKLRAKLSDAQLMAPDLRSTLAEAERLGTISKKGRSRLQFEFKELCGGRDFPGVPDSVDN